MSGNGSTLISELGKDSKDQPDPNEVEDLLRQISESSNIPTEQVEEYPAENDEPSAADIEAAMQQVNKIPTTRRTLPPKTRNRHNKPVRQYSQDDDEYAPVPSAMRKQGPTTRQFLVQYLHLPIIVALAIIIVFTNPLSEMIGTWIPSAAGAIYNGALQPMGLYVRAGLVGLILFVYKYFVSTIFPSVSL